MALQYNQADTYVQATLNHQLPDRLHGIAPIKAFTALPATTPLSAFGTTRVAAKHYAHVELEKIQIEELHKVVIAVDEMHYELEVEAAKKKSK